MRVLDGCCGGGGASRGWHDAGFEVVGVDIAPQPEYPYEFIQGDAIAFIADHLDDFDVFSVSPPCQAASSLTKGTNKGRLYPQLIPQFREVLQRTNKPWFMENVVGAPMRTNLLLCGEMFRLGVIRHRIFEIGNARIVPQRHYPHRGRVRGWRHGENFDGPYSQVYGEGGGKGSVEQWQRAMKIDWISDRGTLAEAIPPAYTQFIGTQMMRQFRQGNLS